MVAAAVVVVVAWAADATFDAKLRCDYRCSRMTEHYVTFTAGWLPQVDGRGRGRKLMPKPRFGICWLMRSRRLSKPSSYSAPH